MSCSDVLKKLSYYINTQHHNPEDHNLNIKDLAKNFKKLRINF